MLITNLISVMEFYQWRRRVCRKADKPSIMTKIASVRLAQKAKIR